MSYDLALFFPQPVFPAQEWCEILESFRSETCEVNFQAAGESCGATSCCLVADGSVIDVGVRSTDGEPGSCAPSNTRWIASISTTMGRSGLAWWIEFAIPYHVLVLLPGVTVHDCQYHLGRSAEEASWTDPEMWRQYAQRFLWRMLGQKGPLIERGLFNPDGTIRF